jgi:sugar lactone lactonase YvrE
MVRRMLMTVALVAVLASQGVAQSPGRVVYRSGNFWFSDGPGGPKTTYRIGDTTFRYWPGGSSTTTTYRFGDSTLKSPFGTSNGSSWSKDVWQWLVK